MSIDGLFVIQILRHQQLLLPYCNFHIEILHTVLYLKTKIAFGWTQFQIIWNLIIIIIDNFYNALKVFLLPICGPIYVNGQYTDHFPFLRPVLPEIFISVQHLVINLPLRDKFTAYIRVFSMPYAFHWADCNHLLYPPSMRKCFFRLD